MSTLRNTIAFAALTPGVPTALAHGLNIDGRGVIPDKAETDNGDVVIVSVDAVTVTVRNDSGAAVNANVMVEHWHSIPRVIPPGATALAPQPFVPTGSAGGGIASNIRNPSSGGFTRTIYARPGGNDVTGDGSLGNPYATTKRCLLDVPIVIYQGEFYDIDITGVTEQLDPANGIDAIVLGDYVIQEDTLAFNPAPTSPVDLFKGALNIFANPTAIDTVTAGEVAAQNLDPDTGLLTIVTTKTFVPGELVGKWLWDASNFYMLPIAANTATNIEVPLYMTLTPTLVIGELSADIQNVDGGSYDPPVIIAGNHSPGHVFFQGVKLSSANSKAITIRNAGKCVLNYLDLDGDVFFSCCEVTPSGLYIHDGRFDARVGSSLQSNFLFAHTVDFNAFGYDRAAGVFAIFGLICDGCTTFPQSSGKPRAGAIDYYVDNAQIRNGSGTAAGFRMTGNFSQLKDVRVDDGGGDGLIVEQGAYGKIINRLRGSGNAGIGVVLTNGAQLDVDALTAVTGAGGDYKVGGNAATAGAGVGWAAFAGAPDENDLAAGTPQICRMFI